MFKLMKISIQWKNIYRKLRFIYGQHYGPFESTIKRTIEMFPQHGSIEDKRIEKYNCSDYSQVNIDFICVNVLEKPHGLFWEGI